MKNYRAITENYRAITENYRAINENYRAINENYRAINGKHVGSRNRLSRTLFPWTTMAATIEEVCFEVNRNEMATAKREKLFK